MTGPPFTNISNIAASPQWFTPLLLFFLNLSWHIFYATMGFIRAGRMLF